MKKVIALSLKTGTKAALNQQENKSAFISQVIEKYDGHCPVCKRNIRGDSCTNKSSEGGRISKKAEQILDGIEMPLRYVTYLLDVETNHCPICGGKK